MKNLRYLLLTSFCLGLILILTSFIRHTEKTEFEYTSIQQLAAGKLINAEITSLGGHSGFCTEIKLRNLTANQQFVHIEAGRRLMSENEKLQDIFIVKNKKIILEPFASKEIPVYGFCCQSSNNSPIKGARYSLGYIAPKPWLELAHVIDSLDFPSHSIQTAVWVLSDNHNINSVHNDNLDAIQLLRSTISELSGQPIEWYSLTYKADTDRLFSNIPEKVHGKLEFSLNNNSVVSIHIKQQNGDLVKKLIDHAPHDKGDYSLKLHLDVLGWSSGKYEIVVFEDYGRLKLRKEFSI